MTDAPRDLHEARGESAGAEPGSVTRAFLFADLRGYTHFVEGHGAASAADLLDRYRALVREEIRRFEGAEIRTEGDSFYVVFGSVSAAVRCALTIAEAARLSATERPDLAIRVGIGIHAGETIVTPEGYVGSPVNIAARICSLARPGEVLVSDTVRALTQTMLPVRFMSRGRRQLKGVADPIALFAVEPVDAVDTAWGGSRRPRGWRDRRWQLAAAAAAALGLSVLGWLALRPASLPHGSWTIGLSLPLTGEVASSADPLHRAVQLAVDEANAAGGIGGASLELDAKDDGTDVLGGEDPAQGATNATAFASDPTVVAVVGPLGSFVAVEQLPITNEAGLLQCSPSTTLPDLTKPGHGALDLRAAYPNRINYVRLAPSADIESAAAASFAFNDLGARSALVVDDANTIGRSVADAFEDAFTALGGRVVRRALNPGADPLPVLATLRDNPDSQSLVFFGGFTDSGAVALRRAMVDAGHGAVPFLSWDPIGDGSGGREGSFLDQVGDAAAGSYVTRPSVGTARADFEQRYRDAYGTAPDGPFAEYAGAAYACTEVILSALREVAKTSPSAENLRETVRAYVVDPAHRFDTVLGRLGFDANGDSTQQVVSLYRVEASAAGGSGDWVLVKQQDFGPQADD
jgi:branched-chain amino acid transport system substrate-binding protein